MVPHIGFQTTLDTVQKQTYNVAPINGVKRSYDQLCNWANTHGGRRMLYDVPINVQHGFSRPNIESESQPRLKASEIRTIDDDVQRLPTPGPNAQRQLLASAPVLTQNPLLTLSHSRYDLPSKLVENLSSLGIKSIYPWQSLCLLGRGVLAGEQNIVYTAPTGGGKSLVADILIIKRVLEKKKSILVLPYVALVQEKLKWLRRAVDGVEKPEDQPSQSDFRLKRDHRVIRVAGFFGGSKARETWADVDVAVCTIEKANSLVNIAIEEYKIDELGIVVLDELHMIDDEHRGYIMELMATKLLSTEQKVQFVGMSATLSNTDLLATWLDAKLYVSKFKPVPIEEFLVHESTIYPVPTCSSFYRTASQLSSVQPRLLNQPCRTIDASTHIELKKPLINAIVALTLETVRGGHGVLVFCGSRIQCQTTSALICEAMPTYLQVDKTILEQREEIINNLRILMMEPDVALEKMILRGVGFHHAGLTTEERVIITDAYDRGVLKVIVATCSLAAGINLPARRVILQGARMGRDLIGPAMLRQMRGRAGRKGKDETGESYVCCQKDDYDEVEQLLEAELPAIQSCLTPEKRGLKRALLEVITVRLAHSRDAIQFYIKRTLLYHNMDRASLNRMVEQTFSDLVAEGLVVKGEFDVYTPTTLGQAVVASSLTPEDGLFVHSELKRAIQAFVMDGEMHVFYMFTPVHTAGLGDISWPSFRREVDNLDESGLRVLQFCGLSPAFVNQMANSGKPMPEGTLQEIDKARIYRRFYAAFQLRDLCNEVPIHVVARKYDVARGFVQTLAQTCNGFAAGIIKFCERMGWGMLASVLEHMSDRLRAGAKADLLDLAKIPFVKSRTARIFWENGMKSLRAVAGADAKDLVPILVLAQPKKWKISGDMEVRYQQKLMERAEVIVGAAQRLWKRQEVLDIEADL